jgi:hypothetical protein
MHFTIGEWNSRLILKKDHLIRNCCSWLFFCSPSNFWRCEVRALSVHKEASVVLETAYCDYCNKKQKNLLVQEFYGIEYAKFKVRCLSRWIAVNLLGFGSQFWRNNQRSAKESNCVGIHASVYYRPHEQSQCCLGSFNRPSANDAIYDVWMIKGEIESK